MMKNFIKILSIFLIGAFIPPNFAMSKTLSPIELRQIQTRIFETSDKIKVMKAVANTLQDSGYIVDEIEPELGYIRASKNFKKKYTNKARLVGQTGVLAAATTLTVFSYGANAYSMVDPSRKLANEIQKKTFVVDTNVDVEEFGEDKTRVRIVFSQKVLRNADGYSYMKSSPLKVFKVIKPKVYQEFFQQLDKNIFYEEL